MKRGLVLEGGAMRGLFTCGVIDVFLEQGIEFDGGVGISAGAVFGVNYKSRQIGRPRRYNETYCRDPRYCSIRSLIKTGDLYGVDFCYRAIPEILDVFDAKTFSENPMEFYVGATDAETGTIVFHKCTDGGKTDTLWMRASASMPIVSRPVEIEGRYYLDGGIADSIPYAFMESLGYCRNVIVLTQPYGFRKKKQPYAGIYRTLLKQYPNTARALIKRPQVYNRQVMDIEQQERDGTVFVIRPPEPLGIGRVEKDPKELERVYQIGRREALARLDDMKQYLEL